MTVQTFLTGIVKNARRVKEYRLGMDGRNGQCDCIGLIIGGIRLAGGVWQGTHGSNFSARNAMKSLQKIPSAAALQAGDLVYKAYAPGQKNYDLPAAYRQHPDQMDYYHVGVVESTSPLSILHCTGVAGGIKRDAALGNWQYVGQWKGIEESTPETMDYRVRGGTLKMRSAPGTEEPVICRLQDGTRVSAVPVPEKTDWLQVVYNGRQGYCMARYLQAETAPEPEGTLARLQAVLEDALAIVRNMQGTENEVNN